MTYFVNHHDVFPHCRDGRKVHLFEDFTQWEDRLRTAWRDRLHPHQPVEFHLVTPAPPQQEADIAAYVIIIQAPLDDLVTVLATVYAGRGRGLQLQDRIALATIEHVRLEHIVHGTGYHAQCFGHPPTHNCDANYGDLPIILGQPIMGRSGYSIVVRYRARTPTVGHNLLQINKVVTRLCAYKMTSA